jgi:predicted metal-dependent enzyme (double-stranded beta helix superfamily)
MANKREGTLSDTVGLLATSRASHHSFTAASPHFDVDRFVEDVRQARMDSGSQGAVEEVLNRAVSNPGAVLAGLGEPTEAGMHTLYNDKSVTILNVVWAPLMSLSPHNHNMWASIGIYTGREDNIVWQRTVDTIEAAGAAALSEKDVFGLSEDAIHSVTNPIGRLTGAIHVYGGNFFVPERSQWDADTLREQPYDLAAARKAFTMAAERFRSVL